MAMKKFMFSCSLVDQFVKKELTRGYHIPTIDHYTNYTLRIQSPSEDSHYHDESVIGPPNHHVTMGLDP